MAEYEPNHLFESSSQEVWQYTMFWFVIFEYINSIQYENVSNYLPESLFYHFYCLKHASNIFIQKQIWKKSSVLPK